MEVFIRGISPTTNTHLLKLELASILHASPFTGLGSDPMNFEVYLFPRRNRSLFLNGVLTLPTADIGKEFLRLYGPGSQKHLTIGVSSVGFQMSRREPRADVLERIRREPFEDPRIAQARERDAQKLRALDAKVQAVQFGWECRDHVYSIEWEKCCSGSLTFDEERREFRIKVPPSTIGDTRIIAIRAAQIGWVSAAVHQGSKTPVIFFSLSYPPSFETESSVDDLFSAIASISGRPPNPPLRRKWSAFDETHEPVAPYVSLALRLEMSSLADLDAFREQAQAAHVRPDNSAYHVERRGLFAEPLREECALWAMRLPWTVAFQVEALLRSWLVDFKEMLDLTRPIEAVLRSKGRDYTAALLREYITRAKTLFWYGEDGAEDVRGPPTDMYSGDVIKLFDTVAADFVYQPLNTALHTKDATAPFHCLRVTVTPTTMILEGPFQERSNRVMRQYYNSQDSFLRVCFQDENRLQLRFDREVDARDFVNRRIKSLLLNGIEFPGVRFSFLAYSQSALREHAVWFVKPFRHVDEQGYTSLIDAAVIIESLGCFKNLSWDPTLIRCPARYGARISQAFTATDSSVTVEAGAIISGSDIKDASGRMFTDGVGTISPELAQDVWHALQEYRQRPRRDRTYPRAYQVRFQGSKGMLSVDYTLPGRTVVLRPSMTKFESPDSNTMDIARAFDKPAPYYLNRPLIMLLEGLGVPYEVFQKLQDDAVRSAKTSVESLEASARLLERYGMGGAFRLTSTMLGLHKLGVGPLKKDIFWRQMMDFAINHVLRELKHRARIPVPDSWTLVGVADVHGYLEEGEIFACIDVPNGDGLTYLEGRTVISRSPTIHPGDVQVARAIGHPPQDSPFAKESLRNTVVFSTKGTRPLPICLGGGDLDGDEYNVSTMPELIPDPTRIHPPASYEAAQRKLVDHDSTMDDVAEFVAEYITSDTVGIIAITWLILADQSTRGILDDDCLKLAALHSDAVDYPKSGRPVPIQQIPRLKMKSKPDWNAPETLKGEQEGYYESVRAIGKLYRSIELPAVRTVDRAARYQRRHMRADGEGEAALRRIIGQFHTKWSPQDDEVYVAVADRVADFIDPDRYDENAVKAIWELYKMYVSRMRAICADHSLSTSRSTMLAEEEAIVGTIVEKCTQHRKRKDLMAQLKEQTVMLVSDIRKELESKEDVPQEKTLSLFWMAYKIAAMEHKFFGGRSFGWLALAGLFDTIKDIEAEKKVTSRRA